MTSKHECRNCRYSVKCYKGLVCSNPESKRHTIRLNDWCGKWKEAHNESRIMGGKR